MAHGADDPAKLAALTTFPVSPALAPVLADLPPIPPLAAGTVIHRYVIERVLGAGAMGTVYAAHDRELGRKVALKVLRHARSSHGQRLLQEAKALARLSHPNVVAVFDAGSHGTVLFLVMELVDGQNLRAWLAERPRSWREVLDVFRAAGEGLAAAHAVGIIHRDFKPDNVFIDRGRGRARVGDFGVARLNKLEGDAAAGDVEPGEGGVESTAHRYSGLTASGAVLGTPAYMAPEQWDPSAALDARTDQFAFCVALYEALYGQRPFAGESVTELATSVGRGELQPAPTDRGEPAWLRRAVERGLARAPADRHPDMRALLGALSRDPVRRRRRWAAAAIGVGLVGAITAGVLVGGRESEGAFCRGAPQLAASAWNPSRRDAIGVAFGATGSALAADTATRVGRALDQRARDWVDLRTASCESTRRGEQPEQALDLVMECFDRRLAELRALTDTMTGRADAALVTRAVQAVDELPPPRACVDAAAHPADVAPPDPGQRAAVASLRARHAGVTALYLTGRYADALEPARALAADARALAYRPFEAEALLLLGEIQRRVGELTPAETTLSEAVAAAKAGRTAALEMESWLELVRLVGADQKRFAEARRLSGVARALLARVPDRERFAADFDSWEGSFLVAEDVDREAARPFIERALAAYERLDGPDSLEMVDPLRHLADLSIFREEYEEALRLYHKARAIAEKKLGPEHPISFAKLAGEGFALGELGKYEEALAAHRRGLELTTRVHGAGSWETAKYENNVGLLLREGKQYPESLRHLERALEIYKRVLGPDHPETALAYTNLTTVLRPLGRAREAIGLLERALAIAEAQGPPGQTNVAGILTNVGETYLELGDAVRARRAVERALAILARAKMKESFLTAWGTFILARALDRTGEHARARELAGRALHTLDEIHDTDVGPDVRAWLAVRQRRRGGSSHRRVKRPRGSR
ncbi:MAG TPA: serine/threonine-protein kinase [Kofleriaceae bacterium]|nr:serine/threonine-protein kinase [Kofleriaceae bacterium]